MKTLVRVVAAVIGGIAGLYVAVQIQWALIHAGVFGNPACRDAVIRPVPSGSCIGHTPALLPTIVAVLVGAALAWFVTGRVYRKRASTSANLQTR